MILKVRISICSGLEEKRSRNANLITIWILFLWITIAIFSRKVIYVSRVLLHLIIRLKYQINVYNYFTCDSGFDNKFSRIQRLRLFFHKIILRLLKPIRLDEVYRVFFSGVNIGFHSDIKGIKYNTAVILLGDIMIDKEYCCMIMKNIKKIFHSESDLIKYFYKAKWICCLKYLPLILI